MIMTKTVGVNVNSTCIAPSRPDYWTDRIQLPHHMGHYSCTGKSRVVVAVGDNSVAVNLTKH